MYYQGTGVAKDLATARSWLQKAAARGYAPANEMLAKLNESGNTGIANAATESDGSVQPASRLQ